MKFLQIQGNPPSVRMLSSSESEGVAIEYRVDEIENSKTSISQRAVFLCELNALYLEQSFLRDLFAIALDSAGLSNSESTVWSLSCSARSGLAARHILIGCSETSDLDFRHSLISALVDLVKEYWLATQTDPLVVRLRQLGPTIDAGSQYQWIVGTPQGNRIASISLESGKRTVFSWAEPAALHQSVLLSLTSPCNKDLIARLFQSKGRTYIADYGYVPTNSFFLGSRRIDQRPELLADKRYLIALNIGDVDRYLDSDLPILLIVKSLSPREAVVLTKINALVLGIEGPSSHIAVMARSCGIPVEFCPELFSPVATINSCRIASGSEMSIAEVFSSRMKSGKSQVNSFSKGSIEERCLADRVVITTSNSSPSRIGLCRSEEHLYLSNHMSEVASFVAAAVTEHVRRTPIPQIMGSLIQEGLRQILGSRPCEVHYRLLDLTVSDVLHHEHSAKDRHPDLRGSQWCLAAGIYEWQLEQMFTVLRSLDLMDSHLRLFISAPSTFTLSELDACRALVSGSKIHEIENLSVEFAVMVESPALCLHARKFATISRYFSFGLNDLTQHCVGISRLDWPIVRDRYLARHWVFDDPFTCLYTPVADLIEAAISDIESENPNATFVLCGAPAISENALRIFGRRENVLFSVEPAFAQDFSARLMSLHSSDYSIADSIAHNWTRQCMRDAMLALRNSDYSRARQVALDWIRPYFGEGQGRQSNWKVVKKALLFTLLGRHSGVFLEPGWTTKSVLNVLQSIDRDGSCRISVFSPGISCHSRSAVIPEVNSADWLGEFLCDDENDAYLHIFRQENPNQLCFRIVYHSRAIHIEAGWGQAMYIFEAERGDHTVVECELSWDGRYSISRMDEGNISSGLSMFCAQYSSWILSIGTSVSNLLGAETLALEGYFDPALGNPPVIVDIDLPLDFVWNSSAQ